MIELLWLQICLIPYKLNNTVTNTMVTITGMYVMDGKIDQGTFCSIVGIWLAIIAKELRDYIVNEWQTYNEYSNIYGKKKEL